jgi:hypothetical protein
MIKLVFFKKSLRLIFLHSKKILEYFILLSWKFGQGLSVKKLKTTEIDIIISHSIKGKNDIIWYNIKFSKRIIIIFLTFSLFHISPFNPENYDIASEILL